MNPRHHPDHENIRTGSGAEKTINGRGGSSARTAGLRRAEATSDERA
jgi:hypothetical protein